MANDSSKNISMTRRRQLFTALGARESWFSCPDYAIAEA